MGSMESPVRLPESVKNGIFRALDGIAATAAGRRMLTKFAAVAQTSIGAGNHDFAGDRTGENRLLGAACAVLPQPCALDIGANHGSWGLELLARSPQSTVVFVEPRDRAAREIERRIAGHSNATVVEVAVGAEDGEAELFGVDGLGDQASLRIDLLERTSALRENTTNKSQLVQLRRVQSVAQEAVQRGVMSAVSDVTLAKVDIEGMEYEVISQIMTDLADHIAIVQFEFHVYALAQGRTIEDFAKLFGPEFVLYRMAPRLLIPLSELPTDAANYFGFSNWVAVRKAYASAIEREYRNAKPHMVRKQEWIY
jgi:FkbM family methyltransferase